MPQGWNVTYERWTHEDAEIGDTDDKGFVVENVSLRDALAECGDRPEWCRATQANEWPVRDPRWFDFSDWNNGTREYWQGITESRALHIPEHITPASRRRLARFLGLKTA